jgi:HAD superfamily hydrolase (TIGR01484 family)
MERKYRFVAVDLDGTTLNNHHELTERTISQFRALSSLGVTICIATGRSLRAVLKILKILDLPQKEVPVVCYNGALAAICRKEDQEYQHAIQFHSPLETDHIKEILEFCSRRNCVVQVSV